MTVAFVATWKALAAASGGGGGGSGKSNKQKSDKIAAAAASAEQIRVNIRQLPPQIDSLDRKESRAGRSVGRSVGLVSLSVRRVSQTAAFGGSRGSGGAL